METFAESRSAPGLPTPVRPRRWRAEAPVAPRVLAVLAVLAALAVLAESAALAAPGAAQSPAYPLSIGPDQRHIVDRDGAAVFFHAEAAWHMIPRLTRPEVVEYLDDRQRKGFNALLISLVVTDGYPNGPGTTRGGSPPFRVAGDFGTPNEVYFAQADWVLNQAHARGFTVFLFPAYLGYECGAEGWCAAMRQSGVEKLRGWGRWVGNRYRDLPNVVWVNAGDADAARYGVAELVDAVAEGIREVDAAHLHTGHCARQSSGADCYDRPWLDFNTTYSDCAETAARLRADYARSPRRPFVYIEGRYEFEKDADPRCLRGQAYQALLGGAGGHFFGSGRIWDFPKGWRKGLDSAGSRSMVHFGRLLRSRRWDLLVPDVDRKLVPAEAGATGGPDLAAARTSDGRTVLVYVPHKRTLAVDLRQVSGGSAAAWWFHPASGKARSLGTFPTQGTREFTPPSNADWVLVIDDAAAGLPVPGQP
jgi:hypothetical protein